jgi:hypothetical protein
MMVPKGNVHLLQARNGMVRCEPDDMAGLFVQPRLRVCTDTPLLAIPRHGTADNDATCDDSALSMHDIESWARYASAASGFGDVVTTAWPPSYEVHRAAESRRGQSLAASIAAVLRAFRTTTHRLVAWYRECQEMKAAYELLRGLDDHLLRDLGFDRSYMAAAAREMSAGEPSAREVTYWTSQGPPR